jgi:HemY protein
MIRSALVVALVAALAVAVLALVGEPGRVSVLWLGWRADLTAVTAALLVVLGSLVATLLWRVLLWILEAPRRAERARLEIRRRQANEVLGRGFLAAAAKASDLVAESPALVRVLAAQAAEAAGDVAAAQAAYAAMLGFPEMRLAGHRGLMQLALVQGDRAEALRHAEEAYGQTRSARWAWRALLEARLEAADWSGALDLLQSALQRKIVSPLTAERTRAALLAATAAQLEPSPDAKARQQALDRAQEAAKLQPGFAPGVVMAARLLADEGKVGRAGQVLEAAWKAAPHPALWLAYRDLITNETPAARAARLAHLVQLNREARESAVLSVELALIAGDVAGARAAAANLEAEPLTARIASLLARVAFVAGAADEARMWMARGAGAPQEPDWSDLDPEGRAFAYGPADWARLVSTFGETGELIHPRHERAERALNQLPDLPAPYVDGAHFLAGGEGEPLAYVLGEGVYEEEDPPTPPAPRAGERRSNARRRLASAPRAAK